MPESTVVSETTGEETIILDLGSGTFFATRGPGSLIWTTLRDGASGADVVDLLRETWGACAEVDAAEAFLRDLQERGLSPEGEAGDLTVSLARLRQQPVAAPTLEVYDDLSDLMLLDPVHDVTHQGWPTAAEH